MSAKSSAAHLVSEVISWEQVGERLELNCRTNEGGRATVVVETPTDDVVRIQMLPAAASRPRIDSFVIEPHWEKAAMCVTETDHLITVTTRLLALQITKSPWRYSLLDAAGNLVMSDNHTDIRSNLLPQTSRLGFQVDPEGVCRGVQAGFRLFPEEQIYGFGEKFNDFARRGQRLDTRSVDIGTATTQRAYKNVPFFMSTRGYGVFVHTGYNTEWDLGATSSEGMGFCMEDSQLEWYIFYGPRLSRILELFTDLTGKPFRPPKWFYGLWMSRFSWWSQEELLDICAKFRQYQVPCDVLHLDPGWLRHEHHCDYVWDRDRFRNPEQMIQDMHTQGFKLDLWVCAWIPMNTPIFEEMREKGFLVKGTDGEPFTFSNAPNVELYRTRGMIFPDWRPGQRHGRPDLTHPAFFEWFKREKLKPIIEMGADSVLTDQSEYVEDEEQFANGMTGKEVHNHYTNLFNKVFEEAFEEYAPDRDCVIVARAGYIGNQARTVSMVGDQLSEFQFLPHAIQASLSASMCGIAISGVDIGGITGTRQPTPELYVRWSQFGLMSAYARTQGTTPREPWDYGEEALRIFRKLTEFRYRLIPYLYSYGVIAHETGLPLMRPMVLEFQDDPSTYTLGLQYMLGKELLVAPIYDETNQRRIYFPKGWWIHYWDKREIEGPAHVVWEAPLDTIPVFVRAGSILPLGPVMQYVGERPLDLLTIELYPGKSTSFRLYEGDGTIDIRSVEDGTGTITLDIDALGVSPGFEIFVYQPETPRTVQISGRQIDRAVDETDYAQGSLTWLRDTDHEVTRIKAPGAAALHVTIACDPWRID